VGVRSLALLLALAAATPAAAQPACPTCARGVELVDKLGLAPLRALAGELAALQLADPLPPAQYTRIVELRAREPALARLGAVDDADLVAIAAGLCGAPTGACADATARALRCLADRCEVAFPVTYRRAADPLQDCRRRDDGGRTAPIGVGMSGGSGWLRSRYPTDGHASVAGIEARVRLGRRLGAVARFDHVEAYDAATDENGNGKDDVQTGSIVRIEAMAGPSLVLDRTKFESTIRFLRLDLLGGYVSTRTQAEERGPAVGVDLGFQIWVLRIGARFVQGFGDARDATSLVAHFGFVAGAAPLRDAPPDCSGVADETRRSRLGLGFDIPLIGYGLSSELGVMTPGIGVELLWHLTKSVDAVARADFLYFPGQERDRTIHQAGLAGIRIDHGAKKRWEHTGFHTTLMAGYTQHSGITPTSTGSGPVADLGFGWGVQADEAAAYARLHGRFGISEDNLDYRALFLSIGFEVHFDPRSWRDRR
jgi:hypothetical protein